MIRLLVGNAICALSAALLTALGKPPSMEDFLITGILFLMAALSLWMLGKYKELKRAEEEDAQMRQWLEGAHEHEAVHENIESVTVTMTRGQWYAKRLREWFKDFWIWKSVP